MTLTKEDIYITEDQICGYSPMRVLIWDTHALNEEADRQQKAEGNLPLFDYSGEYDGNNWYDYFFITDGNKVTRLEYEYGIGGVPCGEIEIDETTKRNAWEVICDYYGGEEEYRKECEEW